MVLAGKVHMKLFKAMLWKFGKPSDKKKDLFQKLLLKDNKHQFKNFKGKNN